MSNVIHLSRPRGVARTMTASHTETCVICGADTGVLTEQHIDFRIGYVRGGGQTCPTGCKTHEHAAERDYMCALTGIEKILDHVRANHGDDKVELIVKQALSRFGVIW